jgi:hypothetical protein
MSQLLTQPPDVHRADDEVGDELRDDLEDVAVRVQRLDVHPRVLRVRPHDRARAEAPGKTVHAASPVQDFNSSVMKQYWQRIRLSGDRRSDVGAFEAV